MPKPSCTAWSLLLRWTVPALLILAMFHPRGHAASVSPEEYEKNFKDFDGTVYVRFKIDEPKNFRYSVLVQCEVNPYGAEFQKVGEFSRPVKPPEAAKSPGLEPGQGEDESEAEESPEKQESGEDSGLLRAGEYSQWIQLPRSGSAQWNTSFFVKPPQPGMKLHLEFATKPSQKFIFHAYDEELSSDGIAGVLMPTGGGLEQLNRVMTYTEWARMRYEGLVKAVGDQKPAHLKKLFVGTNVDVGPTRWFGGKVSRGRAEMEFQIMEMLGVNAPDFGIHTLQGIEDAWWSELAPKYGLLTTGFRGWGDYGGIVRVPWQQFNDKETIWQTLDRVNDESFALLKEKFGAGAAFQNARSVNLGDEVGPAIDVGYLTVPKLKDAFHLYLKEKGFSPEFFGKKSWDEVTGLEVRPAIAGPGQPATGELQHYYWTRRFVNHYTALSYRAATKAVLKQFPKAEIVTVNLQAGPVQIGVMGNSNGLDGPNNMDIFELARLGAFEGLQVEDWVTTNDFAVGMVCFGADLLRCAARKRNMKTVGLLVGFWAEPRFFAWMMQGCKDIGLYLYGPVTTIGPAWADSPGEMAQIAGMTRLVSKFEDLIADGKVKTAKAAILVANTSDIMQVNGLYFGPERQHLYICLKHDYLHVDLISEDDILEGDGLKNYSLLFITDPQVREAAQKTIAEWVGAGGHLWAGLGAAGWNEYNQPAEILNPVFGIKRRHMQLQEGWQVSPRAPWLSGLWKLGFRNIDTLTVTGNSWMPALKLPVIGAKMAAEPSTGTVLGQYGDGQPGLIYNPFGKGSALLVGAFVGEAYVNLHWQGGKMGYGQVERMDLGAEARKMATVLADPIGLERPLTASVPGLYTSLMEGPRGYVIWVVDLGAKELKGVEFRVKHAGPVKKVSSARYGDCQFRMDGDDLVAVYPRVSYTHLIAVEK
ncbi:MAG: hypothetical protein HYU36_14415 [Planctomycetes bacterium]|nr:hypothetical protein [Planctomycetota bacterium]